MVRATSPPGIYRTRALSLKCGYLTGDDDTHVHVRPEMDAQARSSPPSLPLLLYADALAPQNIDAGSRREADPLPDGVDDAAEGSGLVEAPPQEVSRVSEGLRRI